MPALYLCVFALFAPVCLFCCWSEVWPVAVWTAADLKDRDTQTPHSHIISAETSHVPVIITGIRSNTWRNFLLFEPLWWTLCVWTVEGSASAVSSMILFAYAFPFMTSIVDVEIPEWVFSSLPGEETWRVRGVLKRLLMLRQWFMLHMSEAFCPAVSELSSRCTRTHRLVSNAVRLTCGPQLLWPSVKEFRVCVSLLLSKVWILLNFSQEKTASVSQLLAEKWQIPL